MQLFGFSNLFSFFF